MRIQVERDGGFAYFPGLSGPTTVDTDALPADEAAALEAAVEQTRLQRRSGARGGACTRLGRPPDGDDHGRGEGRLAECHRLGADRGRRPARARRPGARDGAARVTA